MQPSLSTNNGSPSTTKTNIVSSECVTNFTVCTAVLDGIILPTAASDIAGNNWTSFLCSRFLYTRYYNKAIINIITHLSAPLVAEFDFILNGLLNIFIAHYLETAIIIWNIDIVSRYI